MIWKIIRAILFLPLIGIVAVTATMCTQLGLNYASLETDNKPSGTPALQVRDLATWQDEETPRLKSLLERHVFGPVPTGIDAKVLSKRIVEPNYARGRARLEEWTLSLGQHPDTAFFNLAIAFPKLTEGPAPLVVGQSFCDNRAVFGNWTLSRPLHGLSSPCGDREGMSLMTQAFLFIFGSYIARAPIDDYLDRGIAFANFYASELVPDNATSGRAALRIFPPGADGRRPTGAVAAWTAGYFAALDLLEADPQIDASRTLLIGHSRHGKSALVAGAWDQRVEGVISHQSGTGGASLSKRKPGESVRQITEGYPHWFDPAYATYGENAEGLPVDQHALIALNAPRPLLLGNGRRDVWSDPNGAYRASQSASPAYEIFGGLGLDQNGMRDFNPAAGIAYHLRPGGHGIVRADIDAFLAFIDQVFGVETPHLGPAPNDPSETAALTQGIN